MLASASLILSHVPIHNRMTGVCCQVGYQTLPFYSGKTGQAFDFKFSMCACEHKCEGKKFDHNLYIYSVESEVLLKAVKYLMHLLQSCENKQLYLICLLIAKEMSINHAFLEA